MEPSGGLILQRVVAQRGEQWDPQWAFLAFSDGRSIFSRNAKGIQYSQNDLTAPQAPPNLTVGSLWKVLFFSGELEGSSTFPCACSGGPADLFTRHGRAPGKQN
ncbi:hypothetical protein AMTR_s00111p00126410 [Amborella trichopoda]|uniref:Uncharacterized protein n=1 Tax=Amborella trichopoda TaxID=13333 RepID=W1NY91_AMBTC|nr:hypothetical protein AMTR_s00111p00126410 [Amborella trichopoda]